MSKVQRIECHQIKPSNKYFKDIYIMSLKSKDLRNYANYIVRQSFFQTSELKRLGVIKKIERLKYNDTYHIVKKSKFFKSLRAQTSQQILKNLDSDWISFEESLKSYYKNKEEFSGKPKPPKYKKEKESNILIFTNQQCKIKNGFIVLKDLFKIKTKLKEFQQVRIIPVNGVFNLEIIYNSEVKDINNEESIRIASIDLGVNNFVTITNNVGIKPIVVNGRIVKSINQFYNKRKSFLQSNLSEFVYVSNKTKKLDLKRNNKVKDFMHKSSRIVIEFCTKNKIDTLVVGKNINWKKEIKMGRKKNQEFVSIPFNLFIKMMEYKCENSGIKIILNEESYTSKSSFLDNDEIPTYKKGVKNIIEFSGKRVKRGMYKSKNGTIINADVNGSYNIMRKVIPNAFANGIEGVGLHPSILNIV